MGNMVYIAKKNGVAVVHTDQQAMLDLDQVTPVITMTAAEYEAAGSIARIIKGKIVVGKTDEEKADEVRQAKISEYKAELAELDKEAGAGRFIRDTSMAYAQANGMATGKGYETLVDIENRAAEIRELLYPLLDPEE